MSDNTAKKSLENLDVTIIVDRSGSMSLKDANGRSRWQNAAETSIALAAKAATFDPDGITLVTFANDVKIRHNQTPDELAKVFASEDPNGGTNLSGAFAAAFSGIKERIQNGTIKSGGEFVVVITDGQPDDPQGTKQEIINLTQVMTSDEQVGVLLVQSGNDSSAKAYLTSLDDDLKGAGAKFDCVDTITMEEVGNRPLLEVILGAFQD